MMESPDRWWHSPEMVTILWGVITVLGGFIAHQYRRIRAFEEALNELKVRFEPVYNWFTEKLKHMGE